MASNLERYESFKERQFDIWYNYSEHLLNNTVFKEIYNSVVSLFFPGNFTTKDEQIDFLKLKKYEQIDFLKLKRNVLTVAQKELQGVNMDVRIISMRELQKILSSYQAISPRGVWEREALLASYVGSVFDIPLEKTSRHNSAINHFECRVAAYRQYIFSLIDIGTPNMPVIAEAEYVHELGHALIKRNPDSVLNPLFDEYISILMELLYLFFNKDDSYAFRVKCIDRIEDCQENNMRTLPELKYLISTLFAFITLEEYLEFSSKDRAEMFGEIKKVFSGQLTVDGFLDEYDLNLESDKSLRMVKRMIERVHL